MDNDDYMKTCFKCKQTKPISEFYVHPMMLDGHLNKCKECTKKDVAENYRKKRSYYAEYERTRFKSEMRKEAIKVYRRKRKETNPEKVKANYLTSNAIRDGRLTRMPCEVCGDPKTEAHHPDYTKPLDVKWLCRKCHLREHGKVAYGDFTYHEDRVDDAALGGSL